MTPDNPQYVRPAALEDVFDAAYNAAPVAPDQAEPSRADDMPTLDDMYGCDPWDDENLGRHPASR